MDKKCNGDKQKVIFRKKTSIMVLVTILIAFLAISVIIAVIFGPVKLQIKEVFRIVVYNIFKIPIGDKQTLVKGVSYEIVWGIRFPRILLGAIVGAGLSVVGVVMQAMVQNTLADPYILGISSGASLGATFSIMIGVTKFLGGNSIGILAFVGALICSICVYTLSNIGGRCSSEKLILSGVVVSAICSAFTSFIIFIAGNERGIRNLTFWLMGSLASASWKNIILPAAIIIVGTLFFLSQFRNLNVMLMGDETAITLGKDLNKYRRIYIIITALMTATIVCVAGTIGFVGLIIPHIVRGFVGCDHRRLIPISALVGAIFLIWTDVFSRTVMKGMEMPIGIITSMLGAPFFMWLMIKKSYNFGGK
ncbi:FecCD family ABC transporter permease [Haloimpatiens massiliensis]|uniref:FecCD family ABC transporter permease n=1 Tax=Haloimpatiens massiliensis TaxID=1658110 RepID=UPI000C83C426|nr:iron ABC transporter permease [Haloimpatiens massiliensis]